MNAPPHSILLQRPLWRAEDLGRPLPDAPHAVSVALPLWCHVIGYEEQDPEVIAALAAGYPRFVFHPRVARLFAECDARFGVQGRRCYVFPSESVAQRCVRWLANRGFDGCSIHSLERHRLHAVAMPEEAFDAAKKFWQHFGEIVSSRLAVAALEGRGAAEAGGKDRIRALIAGWTGESADNVYLYPTGIAAVAEAHRMVQALRPGAKSVQVGFPYVDVLKIQSETDPGVHFFPHLNAESLRAVRELLRSEPVSGVICEFAGNPLLTSADVPALAEEAAAHAAPLIIDETLGSFVNVDLLPYADALVTSLTKFVAGAGDVMAGSLVLSGRSRFHERFRKHLEKHYEDLLWEEDAQALAGYAEDFPERMAGINANAERLCAHLRAHPKVAEVYYPQYTTPENYRRVLKPGGGYGGLFSIVLKDAARRTPAFYDRLRVSKGPSLGTNFTLACPYTLLAHYGELEAVEAMGVSRYLVRVSAGLEDADDLIRRFDTALEGV